MLDSLHQILYNFRWLVVPVTLVFGSYSAWRCYLALTAPAETTPASARTTRRLPPRPPGAPPKPSGADKPVQQQLLTPPSASAEVGKESRLAKALASTIRIDSTDTRHSTSSDAPESNSSTAVADEVNQLFAGLDDQLKPAQTADERSAEALAKAGRLEQLGFHRPTQPDSNAVRPVSNPGRPTEAANGPELDDILAKLDKVLGEQPAPPAMTTKAPLWARADATDEDAEAKPDAGKQLGLFDGDKDKA